MHTIQDVHSLNNPDGAPRTFANRGRTALLLFLNRFDVLIQVRDALLHFGIMPLAQVPEQRPPRRHIFAAVRG